MTVSEQGDGPEAPHYRQHQIAMAIAVELGVDREAYDRGVSTK